MDSRNDVTELVGIYQADSTLWGEVSYWVKARFGGAHCSLCDITHGTFREKGTWRQCRDALGVEFVTYHLNDRPDDVRLASEGTTPCVLARTDAGLSVLIGPDELAALGGDPEALIGAIEAAVAAAGLTLATA